MPNFGVINAEIMAKPRQIFIRKPENRFSPTQKLLFMIKQISNV